MSVVDGSIRFSLDSDSGVVNRKIAVTYSVPSVDYTEIDSKMDASYCKVSSSEDYGKYKFCMIVKNVE